MPTARIALDAMGGDRAPEVTVLGACRAVERDPELEVILIGDRDLIEQQLAGTQTGGDRLHIRHAAEVVAGTESPVEALRAKRDSSVRVATELLRSHEADGLVAAGNTGAVVAAATLFLKMLPGVRRPGIAVTMPAAHGGHTVLCDAGANIHCKPLHLYHYGVMAARYAERMLGRREPSVGLLNIGSEEGKGTSLVRETGELFGGGKLNYVGHIEGNDVFTGHCDVIVCEGFVGNVVLKVSEGLYEAITDRFRELALEVGPQGGEQAIGTVFESLKGRMDWAEYGGAPLLGVNGLVLISHGRAHARAICNALLHAARQHRDGMLADMIEDLKAS